MNRILCLLVMFLAAAPAEARQSNACATSQRHRHSRPKAKLSAASPLLALYDVTWLKLDLTMTNKSTSLSGNATTVAKVVDPGGMAQYAFELSDQLTIDSLHFNGQLLGVSRIDTDLYAVSPAAPVSAGNFFTVRVFYHGTPDNGTGFFTRGVNHKVEPSGTEITFTLSDQYLARDWWPCKQSLTDKIDSAELWFTVPNGTMAGSNGLLNATTPMGAGSTRFEWKTNYPIDYYLISTAIAPYALHTQNLQFSGSGDNMPVMHFVYDTAGFYPIYKSAIDSTPGMIDHFSTLFGRYPFWKEKYGHCIAPLSGGMEHQTMTTLGAFGTPLIAHELGHQWWGDAVTYTSWRDIWMSEGWASYCEQLYVEHFRGVPAAQAYRSTVFGRVLGKANGSVYVDDTTDVSRVFDPRLTYDKGAAVAHMLRYIAPGDAAFFNGLRTYQQQYALKTATTADFQAVMEGAYGRSLDTFFNQWVYGQGYPVYTATWNQLGNDVYVSLEQSTTAPASVAAFALPVTLRLASPTGDTNVHVYFDAAKQLYSFRWTRAMTGLSIDPENHIVNRANPVFRDEKLNVRSFAKEAASVYPNPTDGSWQLSGIEAGTSLKLLDARGRVVWEASHPATSLSIDSSSFAPGQYTLSLRLPDGSMRARKLQKR